MTKEDFQKFGAGTLFSFQDPYLPENAWTSKILEIKPNKDISFISIGGSNINGRLPGEIYMSPMHTVLSCLKNYPDRYSLTDGNEVVDCLFDIDGSLME